MSSVPIRILKRPNYEGVMKIHIQKLNSYSAEHYETMVAVPVDLAPVLHAALTKFLAEENASSN